MLFYYLQALCNEIILVPHHFWVHFTMIAPTKVVHSKEKKWFCYDNKFACCWNNYRGVVQEGDWEVTNKLVNITFGHVVAQMGKKSKVNQIKYPAHSTRFRLGVRNTKKAIVEGQQHHFAYVREDTSLDVYLLGYLISSTTPSIEVAFMVSRVCQPQRV